MNTRSHKFAEIIGMAIERQAQSYFCHYRKCQKINMSTIDGTIFFLKKGTIAMCRQSDDMLLFKLKAPAIIGLSHLFYTNEYMHFYLRCMSDCDFWCSSSTNLIGILDESNLWPAAFNVLSDYISSYALRDGMTTQKSTYEIVVEHLKYIWSLDEREREKISIYTFILSRNHISRSAIYKVINKMIAEGKAQVIHGRLVSLNLD